jgi:hypothetical protein
MGNDRLDKGLLVSVADVMARIRIARRHFARAGH